MSTGIRFRLFFMQTGWGMLSIALVASGVQAAERAELLTVTNLEQLSTINPVAAGYQINIEGAVWWADQSVNQLVLHDALRTEELELNLQDQPSRPGQRVRITGQGIIERSGNCFHLGVTGPVVDNNGIHAMQERSGTIFLVAGRQPLQLNWFNDIGQYGLEVEWQGPNLPRQKISSAALFQWAANDARGLNYSTYNVPGEVLPDFGKLKPVSAGVASNFDLNMLPHPEHVGVRFDGALLVPLDGRYKFFVTSDDGCQLSINSPTLKVTPDGETALPKPQKISPDQPLDGLGNFLWAEVEGTVTFASENNRGLDLELSSDTGHLHVKIANRDGLSPSQLLGKHIRATGVCESTRTPHGQRLANTLLLVDVKQVEMPVPCPPMGDGAPANSAHLQTLTTAVEVHQLKREEAQLGYPVQLQGVVTCVLPEHQAFTLEDATRGLYIEDHFTNHAFPPHIGEFLEVTGSTDPSLFAPIVKAHELRSLGAGRLPDPVRPTWDQLLNGSLDAQFVELQGIITAATHTNVTLLTRDGRINVELRLAGADPETLANNEGALVRIRGCLFANWDYLTHEVRVGEIRLYNAAVSVDEPAPEDLFAFQGKSIADLLLFDPHASVFQRVKIPGQIVHLHGTQGYVTDGRNALRFNARQPVNLAVGDLVVVVGFPDLGGVAPELREAIVRKTGHTTLPEAVELTPEKLGRVDFDATFVRVKGVLVSVRKTPAEWVLEVQNGVRTFAARLAAAENSAGLLSPGSLLELTGVYANLSANKSSGQDVSGFELLLNSAADIRVLSRPPWWTLRRLLIIVGALVCGLAGTVLWITQLHRKVEQRTMELEAQIQARQRVEQQRAMEQERARVAQDLHDELGSDLTEISMLGARARAASVTEERRKDYLEQMGAKAREMVASLDEIVWAMNPRHDSLSSLVSYFCLYADRFLGLANVAWQLEKTTVPDDFVVDSRCRHQLFLAFKEGLTNVVRHSGATAVRLAIGLQAGELQLSIADNGRGLPADLSAEGMDGMANMCRRLEKLGGRFEIKSEAGHGTTLRFVLPARK